VVASYAWGDDYHHVLRDKLVVLAKHIDDMAGRPTASRICVDAAPLLEREAAARAGVGFVAASNMLVIPTVGTSVLLGELLTELELPPDAPAAATCGDCHVCADACPTGALSPYVVDARRCIAYLTIEHRGVIPRELRPLIGSHVFGCDVCQQVCPHNTARHATATAIGARTADPAACMAATAVSDPLLSAWLTLTTGDYRRLVRGTALTRTSRHQLARNAAVALGNRGDPESAPVLTRALLENPRALVRQHVAWALGRLGGAQARAALEQALTKDADEEVRQECQQALDDSRAQ
jgi:epoxyqueuosine reductase